MLRNTILAAFMLLTTNTVKAQTTYYVSNNGSDSNLGTSTQQAWATISKVNSTTLLPGDKVLFKRGDEWRTPTDAHIDVTDSGTNGNAYNDYITFGAFGTGAKPRILGSNDVQTWTNVGGNIWQSPLNYNPYNKGNGAQLLFELTSGDVGWGMYKSHLSNFSNLTAEYHWSWNNNFLYVYSDIDPSTKYSSVEAPFIPYLIRLHNMDYIAVDGLELAYSTIAGVYDESNPGNNYGIYVSNNEIHHIGKKASTGAFGVSLKRSDMLIEDNEIHNCGRRNISINLYASDTTPIQMENVVIRGNHLHDGHHTTGVDCIVSGNHVVNNMHIYNNLFEDDNDKYTQISQVDPENDYSSNFLYITADPGFTNKNLFIYNNIFKNAKGKGVAIDGVDSVYIYYNTFYGVAHNIKYSTKLNMINVTDNVAGAGAFHFSIINNVFYNDSPAADIHYATCLYMATGVAGDAMNIDRNLYYGTPLSNKRLINIFSSSSSPYGWVDEVWRMNNFSTWPNYNGYCSGFGSNSPTPNDPLFTDPSINDFSVQAGSPAIKAGIPISWITTDYYGNTRSLDSTTLGAVEYNAGGTLSIDKKISNDKLLNVYPNPVTDFLTVKIKHNDFLEIKLWDMRGVELLSSKQTRIDLRSFPAGVYTIEVLTTEGSKSSIIIKE